MTAFVLPNRLSSHRLGVTASRKAAGKSVQRNRAKRMLREVFRLNEDSLNRLVGHYDWVLNAKGRLTTVRIHPVLQEFDELIAQVATEEGGSVGSIVA